jgi:MFS family permease
MEAMTHRQILEAMSGLLLGMFVAILSSTVVSTSLPRIVSDLGGTQSGYTWVVTATLLALTVSTPIWGKLADLFDRKLLVQTGLIIFVIGSVLAGLSTSMGWLIACRAIQGLGAGGLTGLVQVTLSASSRRASAVATPATSARSSASAPSRARCSAA